MIIICNVFYAFLAVANFKTTSVPIVKATPIGRTIIQLFTKPASIYVTKEIPATVRE